MAGNDSTRRTGFRAVFIDKDGTLIQDVPYNVDPSRIRLAPRAGDALRLLHDAGFLLFVVSNQAGVARGLFREAALRDVEGHLREQFNRFEVPLGGFYFCPHHPDGVVPRYAVACECRKPAPGMLLRAAREHGVHLGRSWMVGDILDDVEAGHTAGCRTVLINNGNETEWVFRATRCPDRCASDLLVAASLIVTDSAAEPFTPACGVRGSGSLPAGRGLGRHGGGGP